MKSQMNRLEMARIIGKKQLLELVGVSATTWWRLMKDGNAPSSVKLSAGRVGWRMGDVMGWLSERKEV